MTAVDTAPLPWFRLPPDRAAASPPERDGGTRDGVRLLVARPDGVGHHRFPDLPDLLAPGDLVVVNTSATLPAAVDAVRPDGVVAPLHVATALDDGSWVVELRLADGSGPDRGVRPGTAVALPGGVRLRLVAPYPEQAAGAERDGRPARRTAAERDGRPARRTAAERDGRPARRSAADGPRLWRTGPAPARTAYLARHGRPIAYGHVRGPLALADLQTVYATQPGSAEMPSAGRPFTPELLVRLMARGIPVAPVVLHAGVSSQEAHEPPLAERFEVPPVTARLVAATRAAGQRVVAVGTTVVRALESATAADGVTRAAAGWTELVLGPDRPARTVGGLVSGLHEPGASHLLLLEAVAGRDLVDRAYHAAVDGGYRWHEFGDSTLLLPGLGGADAAGGPDGPGRPRPSPRQRR